MDLSYLKNRKTIREYSDKCVTDQLLNDLLDCAMRAPTTGNMQLYSVVITRNSDIKKELLPTHFGQKSVINAPIVMTFCADFNRFIKWCDARNALHGYDNFQSFCTALIDTVIFAQQFNTAAEMAGLGCCYLGTTTYNAPDISRILNLPTLVIPVITLTVGYPTEKAALAPQVERLPLSGIIHQDKYNNYSYDEIEKIYFSKENLEISKQFVKENKKENLAQVFTDVRYTKANNEYFSKIYKDFITAQGFNFPD